ncbi:MAG: hypothetical protein AAF702_36065 [Chloroflexota bacterium]
MTKITRYRLTQRQIHFLEHRLARLRKASSQWSLARLLLFLATLLVSAIALFVAGPLLFWLALLLLGTLFIAVVVIHQRLEGWLLRFDRLYQIKTMQLARLTLDWDNLPEPLEVADFSHPFEGDLDLVGSRSILRLIDLSITENGRARLRNWLTEKKPEREKIATRQILVQELAPKHLLRMQLLVNGQLAAQVAEQDKKQSAHDEKNDWRWNSIELEEWMQRLSTRPIWRYFLWAGWILAALNITLLLADRLFGAPALWPYTGALYLLVLFGAGFIGQTDSDSDGNRSRDVFADAMRLREPFEQLVALFAKLETYRYRNMPAVESLCAPFLDVEHSPSRYLKRLVRIINATGMRGNPLIWFLLNLLMPWDIHFTWQLDRCKAEIGEYLPLWLDRWAEMEVLCSLANLAYLNPHYTFPTIVGDVVDDAVDIENSGKSEAGITPFLFHAEGIGHPLLPELKPVVSQNNKWDVQTEQKVTNDILFEHLGEARLITGSNMSGKSTFLRTLGVNMALAYAGGPVNADHLSLQRFRLFSSIRVTDSVTDGISYFYAEVRRLRRLLDVLTDEEDLPVFFLIDEIYRGTNNRERLVGSRAYITALAGMKGIGLISTHDLELVTLADEVHQIQNYHFRDDVVDDRMIFDYCLRPGPCPTTNALKIMALEGLPNGE